MTGSPDPAIEKEGKKLLQWAHPDAKAYHVVTA